MSERLVRAALAGVMFATTFLSWNPREPVSTWKLILVYILGITFGIDVYIDGIYSAIVALLAVLFLLTVPLLILLNVCLAVCSPRGVKTLYRISLVILLPLTLIGAFSMEPGWRGVGYWANTAVVSISALIEILFIISERRRKPGSREMLPGQEGRTP